MSQGKHQLVSARRAIEAGTWQASLLPGVTDNFRLHLSPHRFAEGKLEPPNRPMNVAKATGCMKANPSCSPRASAHHGSLSGAAVGRGHGKLTRSVSAGEAFASLSHYARVACAHQLRVCSSVWEASIEEVRPWSRTENKAHSPRACSAPSTHLSTQPSHRAPTSECSRQPPCTAPSVAQREGGATQAARNAKLSIAPSSTPAWAGRAQQTRARLQQHTLTGPTAA